MRSLSSLVPCLEAGVIAGALLLASLLLVGTTAETVTAEASAAGAIGFDWETIAPNAKLEWHTCYVEFLCARLLVPLDWTNSSDGREIAIAMIKLPAVIDGDGVNSTSAANSSSPLSTFGGTIFTNPGGPGASGVAQMLASAHTMRSIVDTPPWSPGNNSSDTNSNGAHNVTTTPGRRYEILSWDPRGVMFTSQVDCFSGDLEARLAAETQKRNMGPLDSGIDVVRRHRARAQGFGQLCKRTLASGDRNTSSVLPFLSTAFVARDMVAMLDQVHELRREEETKGKGVERSVVSSGGKPLQKILGLRGEEPSSKQGNDDGEEDEPPRILFWGFSYGSILGNTFASMFPGRVGRMIVDGIANANDYMEGEWLTNLQDTEKIVEYFYKTCYEAGANYCALRRPSDSDWTDMKARVDDLVRELDERPVSVVGPHHTVIVGGYEVLSAFRAPVYNAKQYPLLARALADAVDDGDFRGVLSAQFREPERACPAPGSAPPNASEVAARSGLDAAHAIKCADGDAANARMSAADLAEYVRELTRQSPTLGPYWALLRFECSGWAVRPVWRFTGPFSTPVPANLSLPHRFPPAAGRMPVPLPLPQDQDEKNKKQDNRHRPQAPLLFVTSRLDPVTPLRNAYAMSAAHPGSAVLEVDAVGHCGSTVPSNCVRLLLRDYLATGRVPPTGTRCPTEFDPWMRTPRPGPGSGAQGKRADGGDEDEDDFRGPIDLFKTWPLPPV